MHDDSRFLTQLSILICSVLTHCNHCRSVSHSLIFSLQQAILICLACIIWKDTTLTSLPIVRLLARQFDIMLQNVDMLESIRQSPEQSAILDSKNTIITLQHRQDSSPNYTHPGVTHHAFCIFVLSWSSKLHHTRSSCPCIYGALPCWNYLTGAEVRVFVRCLLNGE